MKLYTRRGDSGQTDLFGGKRVDKDDLRIEAYGTVDELNSAVGVARCACRDEELQQTLDTIQHRLFEIGADLATPRRGDDDNAHVPRIDNKHIHELEHRIDDLDHMLPTMKHFVLPGGSELAARLHHARCICRRAERCCVSLAKVETVGDEVIIYLNRLSDLLFAMARYANKLEDINDVPWINPAK